MITIDHVTRRFGRIAAVDDVSLSIGAGQSLALWGSNGAGKTTLLRCVIGLIRHKGEIQVGGRDVRRNGKAARMMIGYVPQELGFYDDLRVAEAVEFFARLKGIDRPETGGVLEQVGLAGHSPKRIRELSGGMKQRLALGVALLGDPPVLILDEVTTSLDAIGREDFIGLLKRLSGAGRTMLFASHRVEEIGAMAGQVAMLERGRLTRLVAASQFIGEMARGTVLHLFIPPAVREAAARSLRAGGFSPQANGVGLLVPVAPERKAAPFRVLADARIPVDDFEIVSIPQAPPAAPVPTPEVRS